MKTEKQLKLRKLMIENGLCIKDISSLLSRSESTVVGWMRPTDNRAYREVPQAFLDYLELKVKESKAINSL